MSPLTEALRPLVQLTPEQCQEARRLRRSGREIPEIALRLAALEEDVRQALATLRTRKKVVTRRTLNVTVAAHEYIVGEAGESETHWETVDRLLAELAFRRALAGVAVSKNS